MAAVGIDLGTRFLKVAVVKDGIVLNNVGASTAPSCVVLTRDGVLVGSEALEQLTIANASNAIWGVKRALGVSFKNCPPLGATRLVTDHRRDGAVIQTDLKSLTPEEVTALLLQRQLRIAEDCISQPVEEAVVTVPAYFNAAQRLATVHAGRIAGLKTVHLIADTSAAALAYAAKMKAPMKKIMVVDVGAGGTSVSLVEARHGGHVRVLRTAPLRLPGGDDVDAQVVRHLQATIAKENNVDCSAPSTAQNLLLSWQQAKHRLSARQTMTTVTAAQPSFSMLLTLAFIEQKFCQKLVEELQAGVSAVLKEANVDRVDDVMLLGGCAHLPVVRQAIKQLFPQKELSPLVHQELGVARGAALFASALLARECPLEEVMPLRLSYSAGGAARLLCEPGTPLPLLKEISLPNPEGQTTCLISVEQGQGASRRGTLWFTVTGRPLPKTINVTFMVKADGSVDCQSGSLEVHSHVQCCLTDDHVQRLIVALHDEDPLHSELGPKQKSVDEDVWLNGNSLSPSPNELWNHGGSEATLHEDAPCSPDGQVLVNGTAEASPESAEERLNGNAGSSPNNLKNHIRSVDAVNQDAPCTSRVVNGPVEDRINGDYRTPATPSRDLAVSFRDREAWRALLSTLDTLRDFFESEERSAVLTQHCSPAPLDTLEELVVFVHNNLPGVTQALLALQRSSWKTSFIARSLLGVIQDEGFQTHLTMFSELFQASSKLSRSLQITEEDPVKEVVVAMVSLKTALDGLLGLTV